MRQYALWALATAAVAVPAAFQGTSVLLQATTPGTAQTGHINVSGTFNAGNLRTTGLILGNGSQIWGMSAGNLSTGTLPDARLSANVPLENTSNVFTGANQFTGGTTYVGTRSTPMGGGEILGLGTNSSSWGGMYITTAAGGSPYYGYSNVGHAAYTYLDSAGSFKFVRDGATPLVIDRYGHVGIGTTNPSHTVDVRDDNRASNPTLLIANGPPAAEWQEDERIALSSQAVGVGSHVVGLKGVATGSDGTSYGVQGIADGTYMSTNFGVYGYAADGVNVVANYAGYFNGELFASSASAGVKSFMIDHPLDPANKVLMHSSIESDERMNIYRGEVKTDATGHATITVPDWFEALNEHMQYQLTVVDATDSSQFVLAKVVQRLKNGKFKIRTSAPGIDVNWLLTGSRHDPTSNFRPLEVERMKKGSQRGKYLDPDAYGKDQSEGIAYVPVKSRMGGAQPKAKR